MISKEQVRTYYEQRLPSQRLNFSLRNVPAKCPFHEDRNASLSIHAETGKYKCHGCAAQGNLLDFEIRIGGGDREEARKRLAELFGMDDAFRVPDAIYSYTDAAGRLVFEKIRFKTERGKRFVYRVKVDGRWEYNLNSIHERPLYNLKNLITARYVLILEGEKDCDRVNFILRDHPEVCATTNCDGAGPGKWRPEYGKYFAGKQVCIVRDNDDPGRLRGIEIAQAIASTSLRTTILDLPGLEEHGDISDYLDAVEDDVEKLLEEVRKSPTFIPRQDAPRLFIPGEEFISAEQTEIAWMVQECVQQGGNGLIVAPPGAGKSWLALDLALSLSMRAPFLGINVPSRRRVAYMAREDHPSLTRWRLTHLYRGKRRPEFTDLSNLLVNTRSEMPNFSLETGNDVEAVIQSLRDFYPDIVMLDVLNVLHASEENDNTAMRKVMQQAAHIGSSLGCDIAIVHHAPKQAAMPGSLKGRARGASAIGGWPEWVMALSIVNPEDPQREWIRRVEFESKAAAAHDPIDFMIDSSEFVAVLKNVSEVVHNIPGPAEQMPLQ